MSHKLISLSPDLKQLRDEGYDVEIRSGFLLVKDVPYVNSKKEILRGILVSKLTLAGDRTAQPEDHVACFVGEYPCDKNGAAITQIGNPGSKQQLAANLVVDHTFSAKPKPHDKYDDYHHKMTTYVAILSGHAQAIDSTVTAKTFTVVDAEEEETVFKYIDTASSRAEINLITRKLELGKIAIVGLGGTGAYVLDLVAKTPVREIHLFDGDTFFQHNAFRSPGAPSIDELRMKPLKVNYLREIYSKMRRGVFAHEIFVDSESMEHLREMDFVFLCLDRGGAKKSIVEALEQFGIHFVDVGMGVYLAEDSLAGVLRVTTSTPKQREHIRAKNRIPFSDRDGHNEYARNIQIADLNALNAALAVIRWKKLFGYYLDLEHEHYSAYTIDGNALVNEDKA
jgi:hypothetical protein